MPEQGPDITLRPASGSLPWPEAPRSAAYTLPGIWLPCTGGLVYPVSGVRHSRFARPRVPCPPPPCRDAPILPSAPRRATDQRAVCQSPCSAVLARPESAPSPPPSFAYPVPGIPFPRHTRPCAPCTLWHPNPDRSRSIRRCWLTHAASPAHPGSSIPGPALSRARPLGLLSALPWLPRFPGRALHPARFTFLRRWQIQVLFFAIFGIMPE